MRFLSFFVVAMLSLANSASAQQTEIRRDGTVVTSTSFSYEMGVASGWQMKPGDSGEFILIPDDFREGLESFSVDLMDGDFESFEENDAKDEVEALMKQVSQRASLAGDFKFAFEGSSKTYRILVYFWKDSDGNEMATDFYLLHEATKIVFSKSTTLKEARRERSEYILAMMESLAFDN